MGKKRKKETADKGERGNNRSNESPRELGQSVSSRAQEDGDGRRDRVFVLFCFV